MPVDFATARIKRAPFEIQSTALRKLRHLNGAKTLSDLRAPPGKRLEALKADRIGRHSIRINDQCVSHEGGAANVEIVDYHH